MKKYICDECKHIYYAEESNSCPACGSRRTFNTNQHIEMVLHNSILGKSFMKNTPEEKEDIIRFASQLFYPIEQKKH